MAKGLIQPTKVLRDATREHWRWEKVVLDTGADAYALKVRFTYKPIVIAKLETPERGLEWEVFAKGGLVGVAPSWEDAVNLADTTLTLIEAADG